MHSHLIADLAIPIELFHYQRLRWIEEEDFSDLRAKLHQEYPKLKAGTADDGMEYLRRFYALVVLDPLNYHAVPKPLDPYYHTHVLLSRQYASFCDKVFQQYVVHQSLQTSDAGMVRFARDLYEYTHGLQRKLFHQVDAAWWPTPEDPFCFIDECSDRIMREHALLPRNTHRLTVGSRS